MTREPDLYWFEIAKKEAARVVALEAELHRVRGLWYGACAARTEKAVELAAAQARILELELDDAL